MKGPDLQNKQVIDTNEQRKSQLTINLEKYFQNNANAEKSDGPDPKKFISVGVAENRSEDLYPISRCYYQMLSEKTKASTEKIIEILFKKTPASDEVMQNYFNFQGVMSKLKDLLCDFHNTDQLEHLVDILKEGIYEDPLLQFYNKEVEFKNVMLPKPMVKKLAFLAKGLYWILKDHNDYISFVETRENYKRKKNIETSHFYNLNDQRAEVEIPQKEQIEIKTIKGVESTLKRPWYKRLFSRKIFKSKADEKLYGEVTARIESINLKLKEFNKTKMSDNSKFELLNEMNILSNIWLEKLHQSSSFHKSLRDAIANLEKNLGLDTFYNNRERCPITGVPLTESNQNRLFISRNQTTHSIVLFFLGEYFYRADMRFHKFGGSCSANNNIVPYFVINRKQRSGAFSKNDFMAFNLKRGQMIEVLNLLTEKIETPCEDIKFNMFNGYFSRDKRHNKNCLWLAEQITKIIGFNIDPNVFLAKNACKYQKYSVEDNIDNIVPNRNNQDVDQS